MKTKITATLCALGACTVAAIAPAFADPSQSSQSQHPYYHRMGLALSNPSPIMALGTADYQTNTSTTIALDGQEVLRLRTGASGYSAQQRAEAIRLRLQDIQSIPDLTASDVKVIALPAGERAVLVRGHLLATVDNGLAAQNNATPNELAQSWASSLRQTLPASTVAP